MTKLLPILFMSILLSGELEVDGNLKVTGTVESATIDSLKAVIAQLQAVTNIQVFDVEGTFYWTPPVGIYRVMIEAWGGGGGPHGIDYDCGGGEGAVEAPGGHGGNFVRSFIAVSDTIQYEIIIGGGGWVNGIVWDCCWGNTNCGGPGYQGGETRFDNFVIASGGKGAGQDNYIDNSIGQMIVPGASNSAYLGGEAYLSLSWGWGGRGAEYQSQQGTNQPGKTGRMVIYY